MMNGFAVAAVAAVAVGCNCPIPVQLRWVDAMQRPDSNPDVDVVAVVVVVVDAANHAVVVYPVVAILILCDFAM